MSFGNPFRNVTERITPARAVKVPPVRSRSLLDLAHDIHDCTLMLPGVCKGYEVDGCEPAHANLSEAGKGGARKADDHEHAASCSACHRELDSGRRFTQEEKADYWRKGHARTMRIYFANCWIGVL